MPPGMPFEWYSCSATALGRGLAIRLDRLRLVVNHLLYGKGMQDVQDSGVGATKSKLLAAYGSAIRSTGLIDVPRMESTIARLICLRS